jgi:hypothetical protein
LRKLVVDHGLVGAEAANSIEELCLLGHKIDKPFMGFLNSADFLSNIDEETCLKVLICRPEIETLISKPDFTTEFIYPTF